MLQVAVIPGSSKPKNIHSFLSPLMNEIEQLSMGGMILKVNDQADDIIIHAHILLASGDLPGASDLVKHTGHTSRYGSRTCRIESKSLISRHGRGHGQYFPGSRDELDVQWTGEDFLGLLLVTGYLHYT